MTRRAPSFHHNRAKRSEGMAFNRHAAHPEGGFTRSQLPSGRNAAIPQADFMVTIPSQDGLSLNQYEPLFD